MLRCAILALAVVLFVGCQYKNTDPPASRQNSVPADSLPSPTPSPEPEAINASGWDRLVLNSGYPRGYIAEVKLDILGHFSSSYNGCYQSTTGVLSVLEWNSFATLINAVSALTPLSDPNCFDGNATERDFDGTAELIIGQEKRELFDGRGMQICTKIRDPQLAKDVLKAIKKLLDQAWTENCPSARS